MARLHPLLKSSDCLSQGWQQKKGVQISLNPFSGPSEQEPCLHPRRLRRLNLKQSPPEARLRKVRG